MALSERLALLVTLDANGAIKGLNDVGKAADRNVGKTTSRLDRMGQNFQKAGVGMVATAGLVATGLYKAGQSAADLEQAVGGTEAVFKDASGTIDRFAQDSAKSMGLSERAFREATTSIGGQLKALGFNQDEAADKAIELTGVAADLAATYGGTTADAVSALGAAFRGEADPAEQFNLRLNQTTVNAKAVELGLAASTSEVDAQAKAQATLALITEQSADAQGQFAREAGSASGAMQIANAEFENAKASLGQSVAPIMADIAGGLADVAGGFSNVNQKSGGFLSKLATFGTVGLAAAGGLSFVVGKLITMRDTLAPLGGRLRNAEGGLTRLGAAAGIAGVALAAVGFAKMGHEATKGSVDIDKLTAALDDNTAAGRRNTERQVLALDAMGALDRAVEQAADSNVIAAEGLVEVGEAAGLSAERLAELRAITDEKRESDIAATRDQQAYGEQVANAVGPTDDLAGATGGLTGELDSAVTALEGLNDALRAQFDPLFAAQDAQTKLAESQAEVNAAIKEYGRNSPEALAANQNLTRAALDYETSLIDLQTAVQNGDVSVDDYLGTLKRWVTQGYITQRAADQAAFSFGVLKSNAEGVPDDVAVTVRTFGLAEATALSKALIENLNNIDGGLFGKITSAGGVAAASVAYASGSTDKTQGRAMGGYVSSGTTYVVGERGPELLTMGSSGGNVTPNHALGGTTYNITVNALDARGAAPIVIDAIREHESSNGKGWREG
jgi:hypothetical protein